MKYSLLNENKFSLVPSEFNIVTKKYSNTIPLNDIIDIHQGITTGGDVKGHHIPQYFLR